MRRTFRDDGYGRDPEYVRAVAVSMINRDNEQLYEIGVKLRAEQMHDSDRDLIRAFYSLIWELNEVRHGEME